jgi:hypothetical protein
MKKVTVSTVLGIVSSALAALPLILLSGTINAEIVRVERPVVVNPVVNYPVADAEAVRIARENADYDNDGIINVNDPDDDNDGVPDADDTDDDNDGVPDDQDND